MNDPNLLEQQLLAATSRQAPARSEPEVEPLRQGYLALAELLEKQNDEVDEAGLVAAVLADRPQRAGQGLRSEAWLAMSALAASVLLMVSLAATQFGGSAAKVPGPLVQDNANETVDADPQLAWDDHWDAWLDEVRDSATAYRMARFTKLEVTAWSTNEALQEFDEELNPL